MTLLHHAAGQDPPGTHRRISAVPRAKKLPDHTASFTPAADDQASDRAHRIGQTRWVFACKLIAADTVKDCILQLQQSKSGLARIAVDGERDGAGAELDKEDVDFLFGEGDTRMAA